MPQKPLRFAQTHRPTAPYPPSTPLPRDAQRRLLPGSMPVPYADWESLADRSPCHIPLFPPSLKAGRDALGRRLADLPIGEPLPIPAHLDHHTYITSPCGTQRISQVAHWVFLNSTHPLLLSLNLTDLFTILADRHHPLHPTLNALGFILLFINRNDTDEPLTIWLNPRVSGIPVCDLLNSTANALGDYNPLFDYTFNLNNPYFRPSNDPTSDGPRTKEALEYARDHLGESLDDDLDF